MKNVADIINYLTEEINGLQNQYESLDKEYQKAQKTSIIDYDDWHSDLNELMAQRNELIHAKINILKEMNGVKFVEKCPKSIDFNEQAIELIKDILSEKERIGYPKEKGTVVEYKRKNFKVSVVVTSTIHTATHQLIDE